MSRALILMYHIIDEPLSREEARYCCRPEAFARQMEYILHHYRPISLPRLLRGLENPAEIPYKAITITFDDGFLGVWTHAFPILQRLGIPATLFMVSHRIGGDNDWMHTRGFPRRPLMDLEQIREMDRAGVVVGSHSCTHPRLPELNEERLREETSASKKRLEDLLGKPVEHFAYPYGLEDPRVRDAVRSAGYGSACSIRSGFNRPDVDPFLLRRIDVYGQDSLWRFRQKLRFGTNDVSPWFPLTYYASRVAARLTPRKG